LLYGFVPSGGVHAAAVASAVAYAVLLVAVFVYAWRPENPVRYRWGKLAGIIAVFCGAYAVAVTAAPAVGTVANLCVRLVVFAVVAVPVLVAATRAKGSLAAEASVSRNAG
jgi:hypothetical protein